MDKRKIAIAAAVLLIVALGGAWSLGFFHRTDPAVAELEQMRDQMFANRDLPEAQRQQQWQDFRTKMDALTDAQRQQLREGGRERFQQFERQRMDEFFKMSPADQKKRLDEMIDRMVQRQKERAQNPNGAAGGPGGGRNGGGQANGGGGGRGGNGGGQRTDAQRDQRAKERIAKTDPETRAQRDIFRQMMTDRMKQRGITPPTGGGGPGFGRG